MKDKPTAEVSSEKWNKLGNVAKLDTVVVESALDMRIGYGPERSESRLAITLRTPGEDEALVAGYLNAEGIIRSRDEFTVKRINKNCVIAYLISKNKKNFKILKRNGIMYSSCGLCGKTFIEVLAYLKDNCKKVEPLLYNADWLNTVNSALKNRQEIFGQTGGLHAAGLFSRDGKCRYFHEDIGRHNAVDKVIGAAILDGCDTSGTALWTSARAGFELVQKAVMANIGMLISVGATTSLAIETAETFNLTLVSFARENTATVYNQGEP